MHTSKLRLQTTVHFTEGREVVGSGRVGSERNERRGALDMRAIGSEQ